MQDIHDFDDNRRQKKRQEDLEQSQNGEIHDSFYKLEKAGAATHKAYHELQKGENIGFVQPGAMKA